MTKKYHFMDSQERFNLFTDITNDIIAELSNEGLIVYGNKSLFEVLGYTKEEVLNSNIFQYVHPDDSQKAINRFSDNLNGANLGRTEYRVINKEGNYIYFESFSKILEYDNGKRTLLIIAKDISIQKENEIKYQQLISR